MPLIYLPLIMYAGWMEFMCQPLRQFADHAASDAEGARAADPRGPHFTPV